MKPACFPFRQLPGVGEYFAGALWLEGIGDGVLPHRIPERLYRTLDPLGTSRARCGAGVRGQFVTDSPEVRIDLHFPTESVTGRYHAALFVDGEFREMFGPPGPVERFSSSLLPHGSTRQERTFEVWLPPYAECHLLSLEIAAGATLQAPPRVTHPRILFCGDSITQGAVSEPHQSYTAVIAAGLQHDLHNLGIGGSKMNGNIGGVRGEISFDIAAVAFGTNDFSAQIPLDFFAMEACSLLRNLREAQPTAPIFLLTPLPRPDENIQAVALERYREALRILANESRRVFCLEGPALLPEGVDLLADGLHPNDEGHKLIGQRAAIAMRARMSSKTYAGTNP